MMQFDGQYKLVDSGPDIPPELYDTKTDPREDVNLRKHPDQQERLQRILAEVRAWVREDAVLLTKRKGGADDGR